MAARKLFFFFIAVLVFAIVGVHAEFGFDVEDKEADGVVDDVESPFKLEIERLKPRIQALGLFVCLFVLFDLFVLELMS